MNKIFQERINNYELEGNRSTLFYPKYLEIWNKGSIRTINGILKKLTGVNQNLKASFTSDESFNFGEFSGYFEYGDMDEMPKIKFVDDNVTTVYEVLSIPHDDVTFINLDSQITKKDNKKLTQMFSRNTAYFYIKIDEVTYRICIYSSNVDNNKIFELPHEEELKSTLFSFHRNTTIVEIVKMLEYYLGKLDKFSKIEISRSIEEKRKFPKTTDEFILKNGGLDKFMQTKKVGTKNYTVTIENGKISYNIENLDFKDIVKPDEELVQGGMQYVKRYPKK